MYIRIYLPDIFNNPSPTNFRSFRSTRLIKLFLQRLSPPPSCEISLRQLTLIYLAGMVKQFDVNFVGIEFGWKSWTAHFHTATYLLVKGPAGIFCKRDYIAHVETGSNNSLWERVSWKIEFPSQMLTLWLGPVTGRALQLTCIRRALRNSRQRLFFSPTCWRIGSLYFHYRSNWITAASFFFFIYRTDSFFPFFTGSLSHSDSIYEIYGSLERRNESGSFIYFNNVENCRTSWNTWRFLV